MRIAVINEQAIVLLDSKEIGSQEIKLTSGIWIVSLKRKIENEKLIYSYSCMQVG